MSQRGFLNFNFGIFNCITGHCTIKLRSLQKCIEEGTTIEYSTESIDDPQGYSPFCSPSHLVQFPETMDVEAQNLQNAESAGVINRTSTPRMAAQTKRKLDFSLLDTTLHNLRSKKLNLRNSWDYFYIEKYLVSEVTNNCLLYFYW